MYIFIMRHGEAVAYQHNDRDRPLTELGVRESCETANWLLSFLQEHQIKLERALISPYLRAQQTFENANRVLNIAQYSNSKDIIPTGDALQMHRYLDLYLAEHASCQGILLVSHMPFVSYLLDELCAEHHSTLFSTGSVICVDYPSCETKGQIVAMYSPD